MVGGPWVGRQTRRGWEWVVDAIVTRSAEIVMLSRMGRIEPFPLALRATVSERLRAHFDCGERSMHSIRRVPGAVEVPAPEEWDVATWANLNTPADVANLDVR